MGQKLWQENSVVLITGLFLLLAFIISFSVTDCYDVKENGFNLPGIYELEIDSSTKVKAFCDVQGYTVIQSRGQFGNPKDYFNKNWNDYKMGFGEPGK